MALQLSSLLPVSLDIKTHKIFQRHLHALLLTSPNLSSFGCPISPNGGGRGGGGARVGVSHAVGKEQTQYSTGTAAGVTQVSESSPSSSSSKVSCRWGHWWSGAVDCSILLSQNIKAHLFLRDPGKAMSLFGIQDEDHLKIWKEDRRNPCDIDPTMLEDSCFIGGYT